MRKNIFRRILPFLLCVLCIFTLIPESAFAFDKGGTTTKGFLVAPEMNGDGDIVFTLEASKASNTTKWKTVEFYITTKTTEKFMDILFWLNKYGSTFIIKQSLLPVLSNKRDFLLKNY